MHGQQYIKKILQHTCGLEPMNFVQRDKAAQHQLRRSGDAKSCASLIKINLRIASKKLTSEKKNIPTEERA